MVNYLLSDVISRLKVGYLYSYTMVSIERSSFVLVVLDVLYRNGCLLFYHVVDEHIMDVYLKYWNNMPVVIDMRVVSTPGARIYYNAMKFESLEAGFCGFYLISTSAGLFSSTELLLFRYMIRGEILLLVKL